ncbi:HupE/UreJ family protein [Rhizobium johnstonii]|uniref:HupE/UreJ family protein n=1 Tax=Rhizobium TaxID=379 RepID=UPI001031CC0C|nr:HupE/UreJ family protein [Rhizobium leguminosarum]MBY5324783.1 HupE/UreJ family protein [Rhizobium leguminosarum]MBY5385593.1 HupE/UreJ family protein [Rhizobium leguminosarum]MCA2436413.1 HupE/UreJ family protein [Rhizobium leguminosarum]NEH69103.1 HupE/UreJ family protein [Rhizobium leguminosarum]NEI59550.1 HupE/UreJ family protein [Rhizobium leguminosarum]
MSARMIMPPSLWRSFLVAVLTLLAFVSNASSHEIRPAYLQIDEMGANRYKVVWRTPMQSGMRFPIALRFPDSVRNVTTPAERDLPDSLIETRVIETMDGSLIGKRVDFVGLQATITDVLVRVHLLDGSVTTMMVHPSQPWAEIAARPGRIDVAKTFLVHGVEHILSGYDHLLFVLALMFIARSWRALLLTVTAFTAAHSITLTLATIGFVHVPGPPVEAAIAFSILLLVCEIIRIQNGQSSITAERPWMVAFAFGLLHGLGFAGALSALALPAGDIPLALLFFNLGVEVGQLMFITTLIGLIAVVRLARYPAWFGRHAFTTATYAIGAVAAFWFVARVAAF